MATFLAVLTLAFGIFALWIARKMFVAIRGARDWPTVPGQILERGLGKPMGGPGRAHLPHVKYSYTVAGRDYTNDQVYLIRGTGGDAGRMRRLVDRLPNPVPVHYDPNDPANSYLIVNSKVLVWVTVAFAAFALLWGFLQLLVVITKAQTA